MVTTDYERGTATFEVRGLTLGEYTQMIRNGTIKVGGSSSRLMYECFQRCVISATNLIIGMDYEADPVRAIYWDPDKHTVEDIDETIIDEVGRFIFENLSILSKSDSEKIRGHIRFRYWFSEEKRRKELEGYECSECVKRKLYMSRECGRSQEEIESLIRANESDEERAERVERNEAQKRKDEAMLKALMSRRKTNSRKRFTLNAPTKVKKESDGKHRLVIRGFKFPECPTSWIPLHLRHDADVAYEVDKQSVQVAAGGLFDQPNRMYEIVRTTRSEASLMEYEKMKEK